MNDNSPNYITRRIAKACKSLGLEHRRTTLYTLRSIGKTKRFDKSLLESGITNVRQER